MLVIIWHLLSGDGVYRARQVHMIARKTLDWGWGAGEKHRCGSNKRPPMQVCTFESKTASYST